MRVASLLLVLILFVTSCEFDNSQKESITCLENKYKSQNLSEILLSYKYIQLETTDESLIGKIGKIKKRNKKYYISTDRKELLISYF